MFYKHTCLLVKTHMHVFWNNRVKLGVYKCASNVIEVFLNSASFEIIVYGGVSNIP